MLSPYKTLLNLIHYKLLSVVSTKSARFFQQTRYIGEGLQVAGGRLQVAGLQVTSGRLPANLPNTGKGHKLTFFTLSPCHLATLSGIHATCHLLLATIYKESQCLYLMKSS
jgi:hypothetical protein